jgi:uncharacterized Zn finger protein/DNA-binding transcriptional regulator YiaG
MSWYYKPYVPVHQRRAEGRREIEKMKKAGRVIEPLGDLSDRNKIATSFWGRAWCDHLESLGDYANRLPRGRTYVRNGSVLHLSIETGKISALVQGSELYEQVITIAPLAAAKWDRIKKRCRGGVGSLIELLQGKVSDEIMAVVTDPADGLFPTPREIKLGCSCPDWAVLCKHLAAILYGVGARLDQQPELLFKLRGVDHRELVDEDAVATAIGGAARPTRRRTLDASALGDVFGIDLEPEPSPEAEPPRKPSARTRGEAKAGTKGKARGKGKPGTAAQAKPAKVKTGAKRRARKVPPPFHATAAGVKQLRQKLGLSSIDFAEWIGVSHQSVRNWERADGPLRLRAASLENLESLHRSLYLD